MERGIRGTGKCVNFTVVITYADTTTQIPSFALYFLTGCISHWLCIMDT